MYPFDEQPYHAVEDSADQIPSLHSKSSIRRENDSTGAKAERRHGEDNRQGSVDVAPAAVQGTNTTERIIRNLTFGIVNGILLSPVMVRGTNLAHIHTYISGDTF